MTREVYDSGTEKYLKWARSKLLHLTKVRKDVKLDKMTKMFVPEDGVLVHVVSSEYGDSIRITGGDVTEGRITQSQFGITFVPTRFYNIKKKKLKLYEEVEDLFSVAVPQWSFDTNTFSWLVQNTPGELRIKRKKRASQTFTVYNLGAGTFDVLYNKHPTQHDIVNSVTPRFSGSWHSKNGEKIVYLNNTTRFPVIIKLSDAQKFEEENVKVEDWVGATSFVEEYASQVPQRVIDFYTSVGHRYNNDDIAHVYITVPASPFAPAFETAMDAGLAPGSALTPQLIKVGFDRFTDRPMALWSLPYVAEVIGQITNPVFPLSFSNFVNIAVHLMLLTYVDGNWVQVSTRTTATQFQRESQSSEIGGGVANYTGFMWLEGSATEVQTNEINTGLDETPSQTYIVGNQQKSAPHATHAGNVTITAVDQKLLRDGVIIYDQLPRMETVNLTTCQVHACAKEGYLIRVINKTTPASDNGYHWLYKAEGASVFSRVQLDPFTEAGTMMSPTGKEVWLNDATTAKYYRQGVPLKTYGAITPTANEANFALYGTEAPEGFYFVPEIKYWSYKNPTHMKIRTSDIIIKTVTQSGFNSFEELIAAVAAQQGISLAEAEALLASLGVNAGNWFVLFGPSTQTTYAWQFSERKVEYDPETGMIKTVKKYPGTVTVASRGPLVETLPGVTTVTFDHGDLIQDEYLPHQSPVV